MTFTNGGVTGYVELDNANTYLGATTIDSGTDVILGTTRQHYLIFKRHR